jgi:hypothetical protein
MATPSGYYENRALYEWKTRLEKVAGVDRVVSYEFKSLFYGFVSRQLPGFPREWSLQKGTSSFNVTFRVYWGKETAYNPTGMDADFLSCSFNNYSNPDARMKVTANSSFLVVPELVGQEIGTSGPPDKWFSTREEAMMYYHQWAWSQIDPVLGLAFNRRPDDQFGTIGSSILVVGSAHDYDRPKGIDWLFQEPQVVRDRLMMTDRLAGYWKQWLVEHAYYEALDSAPVMSDNNLANIAELVEFIRELVEHKRISMPSSLQDAWLSYRYSYQTTKSDVEEAIEFVKREMDLSVLDSAYITCYGMATHQYEGVTVTCRCTLKLMHRELGTLKDIWVQLYTLGLQPNFYTFWDSLPYSFMVDWFIPIGDVASVVDASAVYCGDTFDIKDVVFSLQYVQLDEEQRLINFYSRWASRPLRNLNAMYWLDKPESAGKTWVCRFLDAASLFIR